MQWDLEGFLGGGINLCIFVGVEVGVRSGREDAVEPGLLIVSTGGGEGGAGELFGVETIRRFLWGVGADREGSLDGLGPWRG